MQGRERVLVALNYGDTPATLALPAQATTLYPKAGGRPGAQATLPPLSVQVYRLNTP